MKDYPSILPPRFVANFLQRIGEHFAASELIPRGCNNQVYHIYSTRREYFLKAYFRHPYDSRDRLRAEYSFLVFCKRHGITTVPLPVAYDAAAGMALYSWIDGQPLRRGEIHAEDLCRAAEFFSVLARMSRLSGSCDLPLAADACICPQDHLDLVQRRLDTLRACLFQWKQTPIVRSAQHFMKTCLAPAFSKEKTRIIKMLGVNSLHRPLPAVEWIASPSDFGFHNALRVRDGLCFVDFEYAGWDDPIKTLCDFVCQPEIPVPESSMKLLVRAMHNNDVVARQLLHSAHVFLPLHRLKWCCIMLNEFKMMDAERRSFACGKSIGEERTAAQLAKAQQYFEEHCF